MASIATTIVEEPNILEASLISCGFLIAAVLRHTLSAPTRSTSLISEIDLRPPPTVMGINIFFAVSVIMS
ncbi:hypothetical protein D3C73_1431960 [compost metagenome]